MIVFFYRDPLESGNQQSRSVVELEWVKFSQHFETARVRVIKLVASTGLLNCILIPLCIINLSSFRRA